MELPIDVRRGPFRTVKYLDEETTMLNRWMIFGHDPDDGTLHVSDANHDIFIGCTAKQAAQILIARDEFVLEIIRIVNEPKP